jgi:outer membrane protein TolC
VFSARQIHLWALIFCVVSGIPCIGEESIHSADMQIVDSESAEATIEDITVSASLLGTESFRPSGLKVQLSLHDAIEIAMESNPQVRMSHHSLVQSLANLDLTESSYRDQYDLGGRLSENLRTRSSGFRIDTNRGLVAENVSHTENNELFTLGPTYSRTFRNGSNVSISPQFQFEHDSEGAFDQGASNPKGNREEDRYSINMQYDMPLNSRPREEIRQRIENSKLSAIQSDYDLYLRERQITESVINNYWNIKRQSEQVEVQRERLLQSMRVEFIQKTKFRYENAAQVEVGEAEVDVLSNKANVISIEGSLRNAIENFNIVLGIPIETQLELTDELKVEPLPLPAEQYVTLVTSTNLELKSLRLSIQQTENNLQVAKLGQQPNLTLSTYFNRTDEGTQDVGGALVFSWPFGDGGATKARIRVQLESLERLRINLWDLERQLVQEVFGDLRNLQLETQRISIFERNVEQAYINLDNALFNFQQSGRISFRNLQDFQLELARSRSDLIQSIVTYNIAKSRLILKVHDYNSSPEIKPLMPVLR